MPPKKSSCPPDAEALTDAVERLSGEVQTLRNALDEFQDSFAYELRRFRDLLAEVINHRVEVNPEDSAMPVDGVRSAARQVERVAEFPGETLLSDQHDAIPPSPAESSTEIPDIAGGTPVVSLRHPIQFRSHTDSEGRLF